MYANMYCGKIETDATFVSKIKLKVFENYLMNY